MHSHFNLETEREAFGPCTPVPRGHVQSKHHIATETTWHTGKPIFIRSIATSRFVFPQRRVAPWLFLTIKTIHLILCIFVITILAFPLQCKAHVDVILQDRCVGGGRRLWTAALSCMVSPRPCPRTTSQLPTARRKDEEHERENPNTVEMLTSVFLLCVHRNVAAVSPLTATFTGENVSSKIQHFYVARTWQFHTAVQPGVCFKDEYE